MQYASQLQIYRNSDYTRTQHVKAFAYITAQIFLFAVRICVKRNRNLFVELIDRLLLEGCVKRCGYEQYNYLAYGFRYNSQRLM